MNLPGNKRNREVCHPRISIIVRIDEKVNRAVAFFHRNNSVSAIDSVCLIPYIVFAWKNGLFPDNSDFKIIHAFLLLGKRRKSYCES